MNDQPNYYETGSTRPPKSRVWFVLLLVSLILIGGIITALGLLNIKLFRSFSLDDSNNTPVYFSADPVTPQASTTPTVSSDPTSSLTIDLETTPQAVENIPQSGGLSLQDIYAKAIDSVVSITCQTSAGETSGTGVVISSDGYIVTNAHVVDSSQATSVLLNNGKTIPATLVGLDAISDLAVLHVEETSLSAAAFGNSEALRVGDTVVAIGDPLGIQLRGTMTDGIVSAINRDIFTSGRTLTLIQTNAALNAGNSGGPLLNCYGQVIGINTMKIGDYMDDAGVEGLGFAIPSTTVKEVVEQLISQGFVSGRPSLGFATETVSTFIQVYYRLPQGVYISEIYNGSNAQSQGLESGDILLSLDGQRITTTDDLNTMLYGYSAGDTVALVIYRDGQEHTVNLTLEQATA